MGDHLGIGESPCVDSHKLITLVSRVVVGGLSRASRVFLRVLQFPSLHKINLSLIHLSYQTGHPLITVFLHWSGSPCINMLLLLFIIIHIRADWTDFECLEVTKKTSVPGQFPFTRTDWLWDRDWVRLENSVLIRKVHSCKWKVPQ